LENLYHAYRQCRRRKRNTTNALAFEANLEENLLDLHDALNKGLYTPGPSMAFLVEKPKRREIFAADFRDRVVHHILVGHLEPRWERRFIHDSYACRKGKGTHSAVERLRSFMGRVTCNGVRRAWYLQLDVRGYFVTIDRMILFQRLAGHERRTRSRALCSPCDSGELDPALRRLLEVVLFNEPASNCRFRGARREDFEALPAHKTLFKASHGCGLPIGNLTSQFFANVYLDALDQFVKHELKVRYYLRYCDDMLLLSPEREQLEDWEERIARFLGESLRLELNERRRLRPVTDGANFLGYIVRPDYLLVRRRVVGALRQRLVHAEKKLIDDGMALGDSDRMVYPWPWPLLEEVRQWVNAYLSHLASASATKLVVALWARFNWLAEYFILKQNKVLFRCPTPKHALRLGQQKVWFKMHLRGHVLLIQQGGFWEVMVDGEQTWHCEGVRQMTVPVMGAAWRIANRRIEELKRLLWQSGLPVAWIAETGRRLSGICERALVMRWDGIAPDSSDREILMVVTGRS
jgi:hypothetical protein